MPKVITKFSTELLGYDNDYLEGCVAENIWSDFNGFSCALSQQEMLTGKFDEVFAKTQTIVKSISFEFTDTGVVLPTETPEFFAEPEETEYKVQIVTITFESDVSAQEVKEFLLNTLALTDERIEETKSIEDSYQEAMLWHYNNEKLIITSMIDTFQEVV